MRSTVAGRIFRKVRDALIGGRSAGAVFGQRGKASAIDAIWRDRRALLAGYTAAEDKLEWCASLPWIGGITKYHSAKNLGADTAKPDVHLRRLAAVHGTDVQALCEDLAERTGYRVATVDVLLWRACAEGVIDSRTATLVAWPP